MRKTLPTATRVSVSVLSTSFFLLAAHLSGCSGSSGGYWTDAGPGIGNPPGDGGTYEASDGGRTSTPVVDPTAPTCSSDSSCPYWYCDCKEGPPVNTAHCTNQRCENAAVACPKSCASFKTCWLGTAGGGWKGGTNSGPSTCGTTTTTTTAGEMCIPISSSGATDRAKGIQAIIASHKQVPSSLGSGTVSRNAAGDPTAIYYDPAGVTSDYTDTFTYDGKGRLTYWNHDAYSTTDDVTENFQYDSQGHLTYWNHDAYSSTNDITETFQYDSQGRLTYWNHDAYSSTNDITETFQYDSQGRLTYWNHDAYSSASDVTETFQYDSQGRLTYWNHDAYGTSYDSSVTVSYSSSGSSVSGSGSAGASITKCP